MDIYKMAKQKPVEILFDPYIIEKYFGNFVIEPTKEDYLQRKLYFRRKERLRKKLWDIVGKTKLSTRERYCFNLRYIEGYKMHRIAKELGITCSSVKTYLQRAIEKIKAQARKKVDI
jgi:RNA polymerase sigma factor (sigma-70 family)